MKKALLLFSIVLFLFVSCTSTNVKPDDGIYELKIFETTDIHGSLFDIKEGDVYYSMAYISDKVNDYRNEDNSNVILLDSGDLYQGNSYSTLLQGESIAAMLDIMEYDAVSIGNHEFDWGIETVVDSDSTIRSYDIVPYEGEGETPVINSNIINNDDVPFYPYVMLEKKAYTKEGFSIPVSVAIVGIADDYSSSIMDSRFRALGYVVDSDIKKSEMLAETLKHEMKCDAVIDLVHADAEVFANRLSEDSQFDIVIGGHSHIFKTGRTKNGIVYIEGGSNAKGYADAILNFIVEQGKMTKVMVTDASAVEITDRSVLILAEDNIDDFDLRLIELSNAAIEKNKAFLNEPIGVIDISLTKTPIGNNKLSSILGNFITYYTALSVDAEIGITNNGGLRKEVIVEGEYNLLVGDIFDICPFGNLIYKYSLTLSELLPILEFAASGRSSLRLSGIDVYYNEDGVCSLVYRDEKVYEDGIWLNGKENMRTTVAVNNYIATMKDSPFARYNEAPWLLESTRVDNEEIVRVLKEVTAMDADAIVVDQDPHMIYVKD